MVKGSWVERADIMVGPGSGQVEELGHPQCTPRWPQSGGGGTAFTPVLGPVPKSREGLPGCHPPVHPQDPCLCLLCTPFAWAAASALPAFLPSPLRLHLFPHPSTCWGSAPRL